MFQRAFARDGTLVSQCSLLLLLASDAAGEEAAETHVVGERNGESRSESHDSPCCYPSSAELPWLNFGRAALRDSLRGRGKSKKIGCRGLGGSQCRRRCRRRCRTVS